MMINVRDNGVNGHYYYNSKKELIRLAGKIESGKLVLNEYVNGKSTGSFIIEKPESFDEKIFWQSADGKKRFNVIVDSKYSLHEFKTK